MADFGQELRQARNGAGLSLRQLAGRAGIDWGYLGQIERGERRCSPDFAEILDQALGADGRLVRAYRAREREDDVRRRAVLGATAGLPLIAAEALGTTTTAPLVGAEALRHDLSVTLTGDVTDWNEIAWQYACTYADTPPRVLLTNLRSDLLVAGMQLRRTADAGMRHTLHRTIGQLSVIMAQTVGNLGDWHASYRWWRTARQYADASCDTPTRIWVRGREVIRGIYERRPLPPLLELADEAEAISAVPTVGTGGVLAGRAQVLAMLGRADDARSAMARLRDTADRLPSNVTDDTQSMFGWPQHRLRHTESFVYTYVGDESAAEEAHDQALGLYPSSMFREAAQVELHRCIRLVRAGDADGGASHAVQVIETIPPDQRIEAVLELARSVAAAIPVSKRRRPSVAGLRDVLALPTGHKL